MTLAMQKPFDITAFRHALGQFPTGVCVVTAIVDGVRLGMTVSSFNSLSLEPPLVLFSIDRRAASLTLWERAEAAAVHVLAENQSGISNRFARTLANKWEGMSCSEGASGVPLLLGVAAVFECTVWARHDGGDHTLFILEVEQFRSFADRWPLVFGKGRYSALQSSDVPAQLWPLDIHY